MDLAPLNTAHAHARKAAALSQGPSLSSAREEHELAARNFEKAKDGTHDTEALRILSLLEQHHHQLADIIRSHSIPAKSGSDVNAKDETTVKDDTSQLASNSPHVPKLVNRTSTSPVRTRRLHRETSSSIADNLARQRRGLPAGPELSTQQAGGRILSHIDRPGFGNRHASPDRTRGLAAAADIQPSISPSEQAPARANDDSFSRFYNTFEGLFSKLSGPLAFAGLPLTPEQAAKDASQEQSKKTEKEKSKDKTRASSSDEPDLTKIYSASALKAIREDVGPSFGPQESFYLVPPTGGTLSYAGMVSGARGSTILPDTIDEEDDDFQDARESMGPPSPRSLRSSSRKNASPVVSRNSRTNSIPKKTQEELELEITVLKQLLDSQAKRLQDWEMSSQSQSMALQANMRAVRPRPDLPSVSTDTSAIDRRPSDANADKIKRLEEALQAERDQKQALELRSSRVEQENERLTNTVGRYRAKWEQLKAGARRREEKKANEGASKKDDDVDS